MKIQRRKPARMRYSEIQVGSVYSFETQVFQQDVIAFAQLTGDFNPLHIDPDFGEKSKFKRNIVQGMLVGSLFSTFVGMYCPGEKSLYLSQTLNFKLPLFHDDTITVRGTVINKNDSIRVIRLKTEILKGDKVAIDGEAKVMVIDDE